MQALVLLALCMVSCAAGADIVGDCTGDCEPCIQLGPCYVGYQLQFHGRKCCKPCDSVSVFLGTCDNDCCTCDAENGGYTCAPCNNGLPPTTEDVKKCTKSYNDVCDIALDLVFIVDGSGSINDNEWDLMKNFLRGVVDLLTIGPSDVLVGMVQFSTSVQVEFHLDEGTSDTFVNNAIDGLVQLEDLTNIAGGIELGREAVFDEARGDRPGVPNVMVVLSDGMPNVREDETVDQAAITIADGIRIISIGIGTNPDTNVILAAISSSGEVLGASDFSELGSIVEAVAQAACEEAADDLMEG